MTATGTPAGRLSSENLEGAMALDLIEHPGFKAMLNDVAREAKAARTVLFSEGTVDQYAHARGSLKVLQNIVLAVYRRANHEIPPNVAALFE